MEIVTYPDRLLARLSAQQAATRATLARSATERHAFMQRLVEQRGLRAQLRSGNLLTGQLYVAFDHFPDTPKAKIDWSQDVPVLPVTPSTLPDIEAKLTNIVTKLDKLPLEAIGDDVRRALVSVDQVLGNANNKTLPELNATLEETRRALAAADALLKNGLHTTLNEVNTTLEGARRVIATADGVLKNTDATLLGPDAPGQQDLRDALQEVTRAARSLRVLMDYLDRHPESLIRGKAADRP